MKKVIIFDLDGTLLNTIEDLAAATNYALKELNLPTYSVNTIQSFVGNGIGLLIKRALGNENEYLFEKALSLFKTYYALHIHDFTKPYPNIIETLKELKRLNFKIGIVSNKFQKGINLLVDYFFKGLIDFSLGENKGIEKKPNPAMINIALDALNASNQEVIYVGDSIVDYQTAINSNLTFIGVSYGFGLEKLKELKLKYLINDAKEIIKIIKEINENE